MRSNSSSQLLTPEQQKYARKGFRDPVPFARHVLGVELWECEVEILRSIQEHPRTAIKACHGVGKTFALAVATLWWLARWEDSVVITTAPTARQVATQLWKEIHALTARSRIPYPEFNQVGVMEFRNPKNYALGLSTNTADNFRGVHGGHVLIIADEAPGIESGIWDAIAGVMSGGVVHIVMAGNPTNPSGAFFDAFHDKRSLWNCITMDAFDTPNLKGLGINDLLKMDPRPNGPLDEYVIPYLPLRRWVRDQYVDWWHGDEASSPSWMSLVRGEFPSQANNALCKLAWLERCKERQRQSDGTYAPAKDTGGRLIAGVDVGGGVAETVAYLCETGPKKKILAMGAWRAEDTTDDVARFLDPYLKRLTGVRVDADGIGHNFGIYLRKKDFPVELIHVGIPCENKPELRENNLAVRFFNRKAHYYQTLADSFQHDEIDGLIDDATIGQLAGILYEIDPKGRIKIEPKEEALKRGVVSPDRAEALMLALGEAPPAYEFHSIRELEWPRVGKGRQAGRDPSLYSQAAADDARSDARRRGFGFRDWGSKGHGY